MEKLSDLSKLSYLVTGGSGFFGKHFVKHLLELGVKRVCVLSRSESKQAEMAKQIADGRVRYFIGDVRDHARLRRAMHGIDVVVHAAALKRIETAHYNPDELVKTNIIGTQNVIDACLAVGARMILLSTDKACEPVSAYGWSKALAEGFMAAAGPGFTAVRYGNVAGSTGSVIPVWRKAAEAGEQIRITDPDCTRFWMTADQAVDFVLNAIPRVKEQLLTSNDLPAYRLGDLFDVITFKYRVSSKRPFPSISIVGLPIWEKKHESMLPGISSDKARRMSVEDLVEALKAI